MSDSSSVFVCPKQSKVDNFVFVQQYIKTKSNKVLSN